MSKDKSTGLEKKIADVLSRQRITLEDKRIFKGLFTDNYELLQVVRNLFFGFELTAEQKEQIKDKFRSEESRKVMRKLFLPEISPNDPIGHSGDFWKTSEFMSVKEKEWFDSHRDAKLQIIDKLELALALLVDPDGNKPTIQVSSDDSLEDMVARNNFIGHVEQMLIYIYGYTGEEELTPDALADRLRKNSNK